MTTRRSTRLIWAVLLAGAVCGCYGSRKGLHYLGDADLQYYKDVATQIEYPAVEEESASEVMATDAPRRIRHPRKDEIWDMPLAEALQIALQNSAIIRERDQFLSSRNPLLTNPEASASVYDPAIQETEVRVGNRGIEAALSDFDAQFATSMLWGRNEQVQNNLFLSGGLPPGATLSDETAAFQSRLQKQFADSGSFALIHNWNYSLNNVPSRLFGSVYEGNVRAEYRRPLLQGAGAEFTRIAGPGGSTSLGVNQGVVISRINSDISIADFELSVQNLMRDVEAAYWDLSLAYRAYHSEVIALRSALGTWREVKARLDEGLPGGSAADEAQGRDNYFESRARTEATLADIYSSEGQLRRLIGLAVNDGRVIRPCDEPTMAEFVPDWHMSLAEALTRRVELRRQKWQIKSLELQLKAARSLTRPELDFVSGYQVNGFGDRLFSENDNDGVTAQGLHSGYETLLQGNQTGWNLGFEFRMPIGFRAAHAQVRNLELRLARARAALAAQELEISHELSNAFQSLDRWYEAAETNFNRRRAAEARVKAFEVEYEAGRTSLDLLLRAQISLANAEVTYFSSLAEYNKAIADIHHRKGTLLEHNNVQISEGLWDPEAYTEALRRAWARSHAFDNDHLRTEPEEFVIDQYTGRAAVPYSDDSTLSAPMSAPGGAGQMPHDEYVPPAPPTDSNTAPAVPMETGHAPQAQYEYSDNVGDEPAAYEPAADESVHPQSAADYERVNSSLPPANNRSDWADAMLQQDAAVQQEAAATPSDAAGEIDFEPARAPYTASPALVEEDFDPASRQTLRRRLASPQHRDVPPLPTEPMFLDDTPPADDQPAAGDSGADWKGAPEQMPAEAAANGPEIQPWRSLRKPRAPQPASGVQPAGATSADAGAVQPAAGSAAVAPPLGGARVFPLRPEKGGDQFQPNVSIRPNSRDAVSNEERFPDLPTFRWTRNPGTSSDSWRPSN